MSAYDPQMDVNGFTQRIGLAMQLIASEADNLERFIATVETAHTVGPFVDPTAYRDALYRGDMDAMAAVCRALREPVRVWNDRIAPKVGAPS